MLLLKDYINQFYVANLKRLIQFIIKLRRWDTLPVSVEDLKQQTGKVTLIDHVIHYHRNRSVKNDACVTYLNNTSLFTRLEIFHHIYSIAHKC